MPFCASCGAPVEGRFCAKCGAPMAAGGSAPSGPAPGAGGPPNPQPTYVPPPPVTAAGLEDNVPGALCYLVGFITGIIFMVMEPYSRRPFVRFHAFQSILFSVAWIALSIAISIAFGIMGIVSHMWLIFLPLRMLIGFLGFVLWLFCMYKAYNREWFQLPIVGPIALKQSGAGQAS